MERLSKIMEKIYGVEEMMESTTVILDKLAGMYELKNEKLAYQNVVVFKALMESMKKNLVEGISELDKFILESKKE